MSFIYNMADTWNAVGTTFNSILMNISNGAGGAPVGAAASKALNLQSNGSPFFTVDVIGRTVIGTGGITAASIANLLTLNFNAAAPQPPPGSTILHIAGIDGTNAQALLDSYATQNLLQFRRANGTAVTPTPLAANDVGVNVQILGYGSTGYSAGGRAQWRMLASEAWTDTAQGSYQTWFTCPSGTIAQVEAMRLQQSGGLSVGQTTDPGFLGALGTFSYQKVTPRTLASLPSAASAGNGARMYISDATAPTFNVTVSGGGATGMCVFSNGANWLCG